MSDALLPGPDGRPRCWWGVGAPKATPIETIDKLNKEITAVMSDPEFKDKFIIQRGQVPAIGTPEEFAAEIKKDREAARAVVKESGMEPQ